MTKFQDPNVKLEKKIKERNLKFLDFYDGFFRVNEIFFRKNFGQNMKLSIFHEIWGFLKKCYQQKRSIFCF